MTQQPMMWNTAQVWEYIETELKRFRPALHREFTTASLALKPLLGYDEYVSWAREGVTIAQHSIRASEAAAEYFKVSPVMLQKLRWAQFANWSRNGRDLLQLSPALAAAYYRASPGVVGPVFIEEFGLWVAAGRSLFRDAWRSQSLAGQFFDASPQMLRLLTLEEVTALAALLEPLSRQSQDTAAEYLSRAAPLLSKMEQRDRLPILRLGAVFAERSAKGTRGFLDAAPEVLQRLSPKQRPPFLALVESCLRQAPDRALPLFVEGSRALATIDLSDVSQILAWATDLAKVTPGAGVEFLRAAPEILPKLGLSQLERWVQQGIVVLATSHESGTAYFGMQSKRAHDNLRALSHVCELGAIKQILRLYCKGLTGREVQVLSSAELVGKAIGWTATDRATSDGNAIFLPPSVEDYASRDENFAYYKVLATHQAGHLEFGTYDFAFERSAALFEPRLATVAVTSPAATGDFERFFDLMPDRKLAKHIFTILEDGRVDTLVLAEYGGIRRFYRSVQQSALAQRPLPAGLPLRQACLELLLHLSLSDHPSSQSAPRALAGIVKRMASIAKRLWQPHATVADSAEATVLIYELLRTVPNLRPELPIDWIEVALDESPSMELDAELAGLRSDAAALGVEEEPLEGPADVDFRGDLKPELVQALMKVREERPDGQTPGAPISAEDLKRLLEKNANFEISEISEEELLASLGLFVSNLLQEKGKNARRKKKPRQRRREQQPEAAPQQGSAIEAVEVAVYHYDEWDFRPGDYKPGWCRLSEQQLKEGDIAFYKDTLRNHAGLVRTVRKQFEMLRPEMFKKIKRLQDGEEFDLDALIEAVVDRRSGHSPSEKIYWRRNKVQRDVSVAFLLDMSASTDEEIEEIKPLDEEPEPEPQPNGRLSGGPAKYGGTGWEIPRTRGKRIIDVEKESLVLLTEALQAIGDRYGIYGFSGYGHDNCEFYVVKDLDEEFSDRVKRRMDKIVPMRGTRMGVAIRHATAKLEREDARLRIIVMLSDGYPQDYDYYGTNHSEREYALHDTKMALVEAKRKNILPFCLTVDKSGHDYLKTMCSDMISYEIVNDIQTLPKRLPALYRALTT